jgi:hypothetical protein
MTKGTDEKCGAERMWLGGLYACFQGLRLTTNIAIRRSLFAQSLLAPLAQPNSHLFDGTHGLHENYAIVTE